MMDLASEATELTRLLSRKVVKVVRRHRAGEILIEFEGDTRLFVNGVPDGLDFSVTAGRETGHDAHD
jgi:hypothetical protein